MTCEWCGDPSTAAFCSQRCRQLWKRDDEHAEYAHDDALEALGYEPDDDVSEVGAD